MKKLLTTIAVAMVAAGASAQGTLNFSNIPPIDAKVYLDVEFTTPLEGAAYVADLIAGPVGGALAPVMGTPSAFFTGDGAGYWQPVAVTVDTVAPGAQADVQVRAWDASYASFEDALSAGAAGTSTLLTVATGGAGEPPSTPQPLVGLQSFALVPEPSTIALGLLGAAALLLRRRNK